MNRLNKFQNKAIKVTSIITIKGGGYFCDVYLGYVADTGETYKARRMAYARELDKIRRTEGMAAALAAGGSRFLARHD